MINHDCPACGIPLRVPESALGRGGTCNHCGAHFQMPSRLSHYSRRALHWLRSIQWSTPRAPESADERIIKELKQANKRAANQQGNCLGCFVIILIILFTPIWVPIALAFFAFGG